MLHHCAIRRRCVRRSDPVNGRVSGIVPGNVTNVVVGPRVGCAREVAVHAVLLLCSPTAHI